MEEAMTVRMTLSVLCLSLACVAAGGAAMAQTSLAPPYLSYAAKFVCGSEASDAVGAAGTYATAINIHNPQSTVAVTFRKKFVLANEEGAGAGRIVVVKTDALKPDFAERVDCPLIEQILDVSAATLSDGFVIIEVAPLPGTTAAGFQPDLDVVGVYTSRGTGKNIASSSIDVVPYTGKAITK
jgi:hypothetical protein